MKVIDPCLETELLDFSIPGIFSYFEGELLAQELPVVEDTVSLTKLTMNDFFCGERLYKIIGPPIDYLTIQDGQTFLFDTNKVEINTDYFVEVEVSLKEYPRAVAPISRQVKLKLYDCRLGSLEQPVDSAAEYFIRTPEISVPFAEVVQVPNCDYPLTYEFSLDDGSPQGGLPSWLTPEPESKSMKVNSRDIQDKGVYKVQIKASTPLLYPYDPLSVTQTVTLDLKFDCMQDEITSLAPIAD